VRRMTAHNAKVDGCAANAQTTTASPQEVGWLWSSRIAMRRAPSLCTRLTGLSRPASPGR
jgi:hypothetical protein